VLALASKLLWIMCMNYVYGILVLKQSGMHAEAYSAISLDFLRSGLLQSSCRMRTVLIKTADIELLEY